MTLAVTLNLPETMVEHAQRLGQITHRKVDAVLVDALELMWPMLADLPDTTLFPAVSMLSDEAVLELADSKMDLTQNERLCYLQAKGKTFNLTLAERYELLALLQIYQLGQLRKSEGMAEAVQRRLPYRPKSRPKRAK